MPRVLSKELSRERFVAAGGRGPAKNRAYMGRPSLWAQRAITMHFSKQRVRAALWKPS
jgi:hypothetical protein